MSRNRLDKMLADLQKLTDDEKRALRHEINKQLGVTDKGTEDEINYALNKYGLPVLNALNDLSYIEGFIGGVVCAGTPQVANAQALRLAHWYGTAEITLDFAVDKAYRNNILSITQRGESTDPLYDALKQINSGTDPDGKAVKTIAIERLRAAFADRGEEYRKIIEWRKLGPGQKANWHAELASRWRKMESEIVDPQPDTIRQAILEEIAHPVYVQSPSGRRSIDRWELKPEHDDKGNWLTSLMRKDAQQSPGEYRTWVLKA